MAQESSMAQLTKIYQNLRADFCDFFKAHPAFEVSLFILLGVFFHTPLSLLAITLSLALSYFIKKPIKGNAVFLLSSSFYFFSLAPVALEKGEWKNSNAYICVTKQDFISKQGIKCSGILKALSDGHSTIHVEKPISLFLPKSYEPTVLGDYIILGDFETKSGYYYTVKKMKKILDFQPSQFLIFRRHIKEWIEKKLSHYSFPIHGKMLLNACLIGTPVTPNIKSVFSSLGLSHILAISGFHFSLIVMLLTKILEKVLPKPLLLLSICLFITFYAALIGISASVERAYLAALLGFLALLLQKKTFSLNILATAFIISFLTDPLSLKSIGFQLSFVATLGILCLYQPIFELLSTIFPKRTFDEALQLNHFSQWGHCLLYGIKGLLSLNFAVTFFTLPVLLFHFKEFPLLGLVYNLIVPLLIGYGMAIGLMGLVILVLFNIPVIYLLATAFLEELVQFLIYFPRCFSYYIRIETLSLSTVFLIELFFIFGSLYTYQLIKKKS